MTRITTPYSLKQFYYVITFLLVYCLQTLNAKCVSKFYDFKKTPSLLSDFTSQTGDNHRFDRETGILKLEMTERDHLGYLANIMHHNAFNRFFSVSIKMKMDLVPSLVGAFVLREDGYLEGRDEVDFEFLWHHRSYVPTNLYSGGHLIYDTQARDVPVDDIAEWHVYTIEWTPERIFWYVDGVIVRKWFEASSWNDEVRDWIFPSGRPMQVQFGVWDTEKLGHAGLDTIEWAGGPRSGLDYHKVPSVDIEYVDIRCYDDESGLFEINSEIELFEKKNVNATLKDLNETMKNMNVVNSTMASNMTLNLDLGNTTVLKKNETKPSTGNTTLELDFEEDMSVENATKTRPIMPKPTLKKTPKPITKKDEDEMNSANKLIMSTLATSLIVVLSLFV